MEKAAPLASSPLTATWSSAFIGLLSPVPAIVKACRRIAMVAESSRTSPRQKQSASVVPERDREHGRAVLLVVEVGVEGLDRRSPAHSRTDQRGGEHLTDVALLDQV